MYEISDRSNHGSAHRPVVCGVRTAASALSAFDVTVSGWASAVQLLWGDATQHPVANYTHVYVFDRVFAKHTMLALALQLQAAPFFVLASYRPPTEWSQYGLTKAAAVARIPMRTSGKETEVEEAQKMYAGEKADFEAAEKERAFSALSATHHARWPSIGERLYRTLPSF